ncbi:MAG TPA: hypothetical protein VK471_05035 [Solirubrobacterales bacterium]|nr:hypothetical protein [Solirubrobacterales bacterium]
MTRLVHCLDSIAQRLLLSTERHPLAGPVALGLALFLLAQIALIVGFGGIPNDLLGVAAVEILLLLAGASIPLLLVIVALGPVFAEVAGISRTARPHSRIFARDYLVTSLRQMHEQLKSLQSGAGLSLAIADVGEVAGWIPTFFSNAWGVYVGFDATVPSEYLNRWAGYIRHLDSYEPGVRLRVVTSAYEDLAADITANPDAAKRLQEIHDQWQARLLYVDGQDLRALAEQHQLPSSLVDLALWEGDYCLLWDRGTDRFTVRLCFESDPMYGRVMELISDVEAQAVPLAQLQPEDQKPDPAAT